MNKIKLSLITLGLIGSSLSAAWIINGVETNIEHPLQLSERSVENGGNLSAIDAYEDGVGVFMIDSPAVDSTKIDNSAFNELVYKYGEVAKLAGISISDQVLSGVNNPEPTEEDIRLANIIKGNTVNSEFFSDGIACDNLNADTTDDVYTDGLCLGTYIDGTSCDDGNSNTINDVYTSGICFGVCDDGNIDTIDTLQNDGTCLYQFKDGIICNDNHDLTINDMYTNGIFTGTPYTNPNLKFSLKKENIFVNNDIVNNIAPERYCNNFTLSFYAKIFIESGF
jgi:hypothetical protein